MKIALKQEANIKEQLLLIAFFATSFFIFYFYSINFSILLLAAVLFAYARHKGIEGLPSPLDLALLCAFVILTVVLISSAFKISPYGIPAIGIAILITVLFNNLELSCLFALFTAFLAAGIAGENSKAIAGNFNVATALFVSSLSASLIAYRPQTRFQIIKAGLCAGIIQFLMAYIMEATDLQELLVISPVEDFSLLKTCVTNGFFSSIAVLGVLPIFEYLFKVVTNISLLELMNPKRTLLKRLILEAPGTYQHSLVVANLSEAAAEAIGANPLLARVGAYYHDIGKIPKAEYFMENQVPYRDIHKDLKPSMSKMIIMNHVKNGIELAKKFRLNPRLIDFITQHHGRTLVYYFYHRAKELEPDGQHEEDYRYPGPRPDSREVAIVALADTVEAVSRTVEEPTPARIEEMVKEAVKRKFMEGELDESNLTLRDLDKITHSFIRVINAIFHTRINYPKDENKNKKPPENKENKQQ